MSDNLVKSEITNKILHLILNDEINQNTLSLEMINELDKKFLDASNDKNIKVVVLSSTGNIFCAGCQLIASCDLAYASDRAKFATPGVNIGLFCSTPMVALSRNVNKKSAMDMLLTGDLIDSKKAFEIGLINNFFSSEDLMKKVFEKANKISSKSMKTIKIGKKAFYKQKEMTLEEAYKYTSKVMTENMLEDESKEGINAFLEKRNPVWNN